MKTGIFYGSSTGYTADVANRIARNLGVKLADVHDVSNTAPSAVGDYDILIMGASTWGSGDLQSDFEDFLDGVKALDLTGKMAAVFGCGDDTMADTFCAGVGEIYRRLAETGATMIVPFNADGYNFRTCPAIIDGVCVGLVLDEVNHEALTDGKIRDWTLEIKQAAM